MISPLSAEKKKSGTRVAVLFDYQGQQVRSAAAPAQVVETTYPTPDDERSAIKQAIVRWLNEK